MIKKIFLSMLLVFSLIPISTNASINSLVKVGGKYYDTLEEAIQNASSTDTITLISDAKLEKTLEINKTVNIDLNGNDITAPEMVFLVQGGALDITGEGTIKETSPNMGAIVVKGSTDPKDEAYSGVHIGKDVTLEGWSGVFVNHDNNKAHGVKVVVEGTINAVDDINGGTGIGVYANGNIKHQENYPVVEILKGAKITSTGNGIYMAGYMDVYIGEAYVSGDESAIGMKAGKLTIEGATLECNGKDTTPTDGYNNGINSSGTTIQIESNTGYAGNMEINLKSGTFNSKNSSVIYEYVGKGTDTLVKDISISGGTFTSGGTKDVFLLSNSFKNKHTNFITGGKYSTNPSNYLEAGYTTSLNNDYYNVIKQTAKLVNSNTLTIDNSSSNPIGIIITILALVIMAIISYFNKEKILRLFKK